MANVRSQRGRSKRCNETLLDLWCKEALLSEHKARVKVKLACGSTGAVTATSSQSTSASSGSARLRGEVTSGRSGAKRPRGGSHSVLKCAGRAATEMDRNGSRDMKSQRKEDSSKTDGQHADGHALEKHIWAERAAIDAVAANGDRGQIAKLKKCPMLARHLRDARAAAAATAVEQQLEQEQEQQQHSLANLAAATRAMPREERRRFLMELPKATRLALETHVLAERKAYGSRFDSSAICPRGQVPQSTCGQPEPASVSDSPPVCGRP